MSSERWRIGWVAGAGVAAVASALLIELNIRARRIGSQADEIAQSLERAARQTTPLFDLASTNLRLDRAARAARPR
jgi:hypothetical protein